MILKPFCAEAHKYFVDSISKAYQALTDPVSRENFEKYGHPDGRQVVFYEGNFHLASSLFCKAYLRNQTYVFFLFFIVGPSNGDCSPSVPSEH